MNIRNINPSIYKKPSFKSAYVSINAFSDTHGELKLANNALEEMRSRKDVLFYPHQKGKTNITAICGDWFMDGAMKGYVSNPKKESSFFQLEILNEFIKQIKEMTGDVITLFTLGNHEFDGGVPLLNQIISDLDAEVIVSNMNLENSVGLKKSIIGNKLVNEKVVEVKDDKDEKLTHKILFLGISPVNISAYQPNTDGVEFIDNIKKSQRNVTREDYNNTIETCKSRIERFKQYNPNGVVVLLNHTGVAFADNLAKESDVDLVFDGHEHKDDIRVVNGIPIIPLSQNFKKLINAKIKIDDSGKLDCIKIKSYSPISNNKVGPLSKLYDNLFKDDIKKVYSINAENPDINVLDLKNLREGNNYLANFVTDSILEEIQRKDSSINFFALNASAIRHPLKVSRTPEISSFDIMNVLRGIKEEDGKIMTTELSGREIISLVLDNYIFCSEEPQKNPIIHYSGLNTDRTNLLKAYQEGKSIDEMAQYVIDSTTGEPLSPDSIYKIANVEKYFNKSQNPKIKGLKEKSQYTGDTIQKLFKQHFAEKKSRLYAKCDERIK